MPHIQVQFMLDTFFECQSFEKLNQFEVIKLGSGFVDSEIVQKSLDTWRSRISSVIGEEDKKTKKSPSSYISKNETATASGKREDITLNLMSGKAFEYLAKNGF